MGLLREFDTLVDDLGMTHEVSLAELESFDRFKDNYPNLGSHNLSEETHARMVARVATILELSRAISETDDVQDFIHNRREEVYHSAELLADCATSDTTTQPGFYTEFMQVIREMGEAANFIDTVIDFKQDQAEQKVTIIPTREFYFRIGRIALVNFLNVFPTLVRPRVAKQFIDMSVMRLNNRRKHGKTPYSSIKNIPKDI